MEKFERDLNEIIELSNNGCDPVHQSQTNLTEADIRFLSAKGLISMQPAGDDLFYMILKPEGITYFSDQKELHKKEQQEKADKRKDRIFQVLLVLIGAVVGMILDHLTGALDFIVNLFH